MDEAKYEQIVRDLRSTVGKVRRKGREYEISRAGWTADGASATEQMPDTWEPVGADVIDRLVLEGQLKRTDISEEENT